jgi:uncharacterized Zn finger protein
MQNQPPMNIDLTKAQDITCDNCGNYTFQEVALMKRLSALISPTGKEAVVPIPTFACNACGFINKQFLPVAMRDDVAANEAVNKPTLTLEK